jgi:signal peptidase I
MEKKAVLKNAASHLWTEWMKPLAIVAAFVLPFKSAIADWNWVPTGSMKPTIMEGDLVFVNKLAYDLKVPFTLWRVAEWKAPSRGDIIVFFSPKDGTRMVKRVMAGPGDTIAMKNNTLFLNGQKLEYEAAKSNLFAHETYEDGQAILATEKLPDTPHWVLALPNVPALRSFSELKVPKDKYFVMGDSRDNSADSRYFGFVDRKQIVGKTDRAILSFDKNHSYKPRWNRIFSSLDG